MGWVVRDAPVPRNLPLCSKSTSLQKKMFAVVEVLGVSLRDPQRDLHSRFYSDSDSSNLPIRPIAAAILLAVSPCAKILRVTV